MGFLYVLGLNCVIQMDFSDCFRKSNNGFKLSHCNWDTVGLPTDSLILGSSSICNIEVLEHVLGLLWECWSDLHFGIADVFSHELNWDILIPSDFFSLCMHVKIQNMRCNGFVDSVFSDITNDENGIKSTQDWTLEVNLFSSMLKIVISSKQWICSS